jgi:hypothetical protein
MVATRIGSPSTTTNEYGRRRGEPRAVGGGDITVIASGQTTVTGLATDGTNVYWTLFSNRGLS